MNFRPRKRMRETPPAKFTRAVGPAFPMRLSGKTPPHAHAVPLFTARDTKTRTIDHTASFNGPFTLGQNITQDIVAFSMGGSNNSMTDVYGGSAGGLIKVQPVTSTLPALTPIELIFADQQGQDPDFVVPSVVPWFESPLSKRSPASMPSVFPAVTRDPRTGRFTVRINRLSNSMLGLYLGNIDRILRAQAAFVNADRQLLFGHLRSLRRELMNETDANGNAVGSPHGVAFVAFVSMMIDGANVVNVGAAGAGAARRYTPERLAEFYSALWEFSLMATYKPRRLLLVDPVEAGSIYVSVLFA